jgi:adenosylcobyric acid synthase
VRGYEIRHGRTGILDGWTPWLELADAGGRDDVESSCDHNALVFGTSLHGLFEEDRFRAAFLSTVAAARGRNWQSAGDSFGAARESQIDRVADACAAHLDLPALWRLVERGARAF